MNLVRTQSLFYSFPIYYFHHHIKSVPERDAGYDPSTCAANNIETYDDNDL